MSQRQEVLFRQSMHVEKPFLNIARIYPLSQRGVELIVRHAETVPKCERVLVFGSSVTTGCHNYSDIDIYVEGCSVSEFGSFPLDSYNTEVDIISSLNVTPGSDLWNEIWFKGVCVYDKQFSHQSYSKV